jgi:pyruvate kinase
MGDTKIRTIVTAPPYAPFLSEVAAHPLVAGLRLNTVMPVRGGPDEALARLAELGQPLWVDLKGRQLRVVGAAVPPYSSITLSHKIEVPTPVVAFLSDGREQLSVAEVDGERLILADGPHRLIGPGESVNIAHPQLKILGTLTETDRLYLEAMRRRGLRQVMLSYVEEASDVDEVRALLPEAEVMLKIESRRGLAFVRREGARRGRLVAARGDLFVEVERPHQILGAERAIVAADPDAVAASRLCESLVEHPVPSCADISDIALLISLGYRTFLLGDALCLRRETVLEALNLLGAVAGEV